VVNPKLGDLLNEVAQILAEDTEYPLEGTFLYAEFDWAMVGASVFKDLGDRLVYRWPSDYLSHKLLDLWYEEEPEKRWATMEYTIVGGEFHTTFVYPDEIDPEEGSIDRRERILAQRYGNKRIDYPPIPGAGEITDFS
jgi:hypothetical protein